MNTAVAETTEAEILSHAIEAINGADWKEVAPVVIQLKLPERDLNRVDLLLERNREGLITNSERTELERYLRVGNFIDLIRARARRELGQN